MTRHDKTQKVFVSAKLDVNLINELEIWAEQRGLSRSSAMRRAIELMLASDGRTPPPAA